MCYFNSLSPSLSLLLPPSLSLSLSLPLPPSVQLVLTVRFVVLVSSVLRAVCPLTPPPVRPVGATLRESRTMGVVLKMRE